MMFFLLRASFSLSVRISNIDSEKIQSMYHDPCHDKFPSEVVSYRDKQTKEQL